MGELKFSLGKEERNKGREIFTLNLFFWEKSYPDHRVALRAGQRRL